MKTNAAIRWTLLSSISALILVCFQNCSNTNGFDVLSSEGLQLNGGAIKNSVLDPDASGAPQEVICQKKLRVQPSFEGKAVTDGSVITSVNQVISNAPYDLRGCTTLAAPEFANKYCIKDSDFVFMRDAWGPASYDANKRTFSHFGDTSTAGFPNGKYITRLKYADHNDCQDKIIDHVWEPVVFTFPAPTPYMVSASLKWVRTMAKGCFGPSSPPVKIGSSCSNEGQSVTDDCGTITCQYSADK